MKKRSVILLFGGSSEERKVSVATAQNIADSLSGATFWFLNTKGEVFSVSKEKLISHSNPFLSDFVPDTALFGKTLEEALSKLHPPFPVLFLGLHGGEGENGHLQALFEKKKIPFTGSGSESSHQAFEKGLGRQAAIELGIPIANGKEFLAQEKNLQAFLTERFEKQGPQVLKPVDGGSSIGMFFLREKKEIPQIAEGLKAQGQRRYLAETLIVGRELTVGVLDEGTRVFALPPSEVRTEKDHTFDYEGKYLGKGSLEITPAEISSYEMKACQDIAVKMHKQLGCYGYSRTDLILSEKGPYYLETNTLPGLTKASFYPQQLAVAKIPFSDFVSLQVELAERRNEKASP